MIGLNEYDINSPPSQNSQTNTQNDLWVGTWQQYQQSLYTQVKSSGQPAWVNDLPVVSGPIANAFRVGTLDNVGLGDDVEGSPRWLTEFGVNNLLSDPNRQGISERASGKFLNRVVLENFDRGVARQLIFELYDKTDSEDPRENAVGLVRADGTAKPQYTALKNLMDLMVDIDVT